MYCVNYVAEYAFWECLVKHVIALTCCSFPPSLFSHSLKQRGPDSQRNFAVLHQLNGWPLHYLLVKVAWSFNLIKTWLSKWIKAVFNIITLNSWIRYGNKSLTFTLGVFLELVNVPHVAGTRFHYTYGEFDPKISNVSQT